MFKVTPWSRARLATVFTLLMTVLLVNAPAVEPAAQPKDKAASARPGKNWEADDLIRSAMVNIQLAMVSRKEGLANDRLGADDYKGLAKLMEVNLVKAERSSRAPVASLKAFQAVVAIDLRRSAELMRSGATLKLQRAGALGVPQILHNYGQYFQHPGWVDAY